MSNYMLNLYIKNLYKKDLYEKEKGKTFLEFENELKERLTNLNSKELIDLYINYSRVSFMMINPTPIEALLEIIYNVLESSLNRLSISDLIDLITIVSNQILRVNSNINSNTNIINARTSNLKNDFFITNESRNKKISKEKFISNYENEIQAYISNLEFCHASFYFLNRISTLLDSKIVEKIDNLTDIEKDNLLIVLNSKIEEFSNLILRVDELFNNKVAREIEFKLGVDALLDLVNSSNFENLKNSLELYNKYTSLITENEFKKN